MGRTDLDTYSFVFYAETDKAIGVREEGDSEDSDMIWLPKSQIEYDDNCSEGDLIDVDIPEWLAEDKDLI